MTVKGDKAELTFWGTRGSISTPGRSTEKYGGNTPCVSYAVGDTLIIIDAGTGIRNLGIELANGQKEYKELHLLLSHTHWDHIQGLPFFLPSYFRGIKINVYGNPNKGGFLGSILEGQMDYDYFPVDMSSLGAEVNIVELEDSEMQFGPVKMNWEEQVYHPGGCLRFRLEYNDRAFVYASDVVKARPRWVNRCIVLVVVVVIIGLLLGLFLGIVAKSINDRISGGRFSSSRSSWKGSAGALGSNV